MADPPNRKRDQAPPGSSTEEISGVGWPGQEPAPPPKPVRAEKAPTLLGAPGPGGAGNTFVTGKGDKRSPTMLSNSMRTPPGVRLADLQPKGPLAMVGRVTVIVVVIVSLLALGWLTKTVILPMIMNSNVRVNVVTVRGQTRTPMFFPGAAAAVHARSEQWLSFGLAGQLAGPLPKAGTSVKKGEILARLKLSPQRQIPLDKAQKALVAATREHAAAQVQVKKLAAVKQAALGDLRAAEDRVKASHQKTPAGHGHKAGAKHGKKDVASATKRLIAIDKKARGPQDKLAKSEAALQQARDNVKKIETGMGETVLRAPFDGDVVQAKMPANGVAAARAPLLLVQDRTQARVSFRMDEPGGLKKGEPVMVAVGGRPAIPGMVFDMQGAGTSYEVWADLPDANGALINTNANNFRLVRGFAPLAFVVPLDALVGHDDQVALWIVQGSHAIRQRVQVLEVRGSEVVVWDATATMPREIRVVHSRADGHPIMALTEDTEVIPVEEGKSAPRPKAEGS